MTRSGAAAFCEERKKQRQHSSPRHPEDNQVAIAHSDAALAESEGDHHAKAFAFPYKFAPKQAPQGTEPGSVPAAPATPTATGRPVVLGRAAAPAPVFSAP